MKFYTEKSKTQSDSITSFGTLRSSISSERHSISNYHCSEINVNQNVNQRQTFAVLEGYILPHSVLITPYPWSESLISSEKRKKDRFSKVGEKEEDKQHGGRQDGTTLNRLKRRQKSAQRGWDE